MLRSALVSPREDKKFPLRIRQPAFSCDLAEPLRQLAIMCSAVPQPPIPISRGVVPCKRVFICHSARYGWRLVADYVNAQNAAGYLQQRMVVVTNPTSPIRAL